MSNVILAYYQWRPPSLRHQRTTVMGCYHASCFPSALARMRSDLELVFDDREAVLQAQTNASVHYEQRTLVDCYIDSFISSLMFFIRSQLLILRDNFIRDNLMIVMQAQEYALDPPLVFESVAFNPFQAFLWEHLACIRAAPMPDEDCCQPWSPVPDLSSQPFVAPAYHSPVRVSVASPLMIDRCDHLIRPWLRFTSSRNHQHWLFARRNLRSRQLLCFVKACSRPARTRKHHSRRHDRLPPMSRHDPAIRSLFKPSFFNSTLGFPGKTNTKFAIVINTSVSLVIVCCRQCHFLLSLSLLLFFVVVSVTFC